ncbi:hypothetical protein HIV01_015625 [Lysobacter arenosi]|uniref:Uncharacterized protein n=1 Tax=Lysobacter arenosi TaxID=2795387 RepID=A0ABX7R8Y9_9GAMM|nr:hypothetical protein [Lysobacter arenosi]QSX74588.1 hypothetical protein HIV01_015625 [Lysobacter arenosi]
MPASKLAFLVLALVLLGLFAKWKWLKVAFISLAAMVALLAAAGFFG